MVNKKSLFPDLVSILSLLAISILVYGIFIGKLGFYQDDWPLIWVYHSLGPEGLRIYFSGNRPIYGLMYSLIFPCLGLSPIRWHVFAVALRCLSSVSLFFAFRALWPEKRDTAWLIAVFALFYTGFTQQSLAVAYSPHYISFILFSISITGTIFSIRSMRNQWLYTFISILSGLFGYLIIEYFVGLELLRPVIILLVMQSISAPKKYYIMLKDVLLKWSPYIICITAFILWRLFFYKTWPPDHDGISQISEIIKNPYFEIKNRFVGGINNLLMSTFFAWAQSFSPEILNYKARIVPISWVIGLFVAGTAVIREIIISYYEKRTGYASLMEYEKSSTRTVIIVGGIALVVAGLPNMFANLLVTLNRYDFTDRYTLPYLFGSSVLLAGILQIIRLRYIQKLLLLSIIMFLLGSFHVRSNNNYLWNWDEQKSVFWQFAWRIPALEKGTNIFFIDIPFSLQGNHAAGNMNLLYNEDDSLGRLEYYIIDLNRGLVSSKTNIFTSKNIVTTLKPGEPITGGLRSFKFNGITSKSLVAWKSPSGTLRIIDAKHVNEVPGLPPIGHSVAHLSDLSRVVHTNIGKPGGPLLNIYGPEPVHGWSYFYQKADLERQFFSWDNVTRLGDEARLKGFIPEDPSEWFPFIEGYAMTRRYDLAMELTEKVLDASPGSWVALSRLWGRIIRHEPSILQETGKGLDALREKILVNDQVYLPE